MTNLDDVLKLAGLLGLVLVGLTYSPRAALAVLSLELLLVGWLLERNQ